MINAKNDLIEVQLGMNEEEYLTMITDHIELTNDEKYKKFLEIYKHLSFQEKEIIRYINPESLFSSDNETLNFSFLYSVNLNTVNSAKFVNVINNMVDKLKESN